MGSKPLLAVLGILGYWEGPVSQKVPRNLLEILESGVGPALGGQFWLLDLDPT